MGRSIALYTLLLILPGGVLAALAFRLAGSERRDAIRVLDERIDRAASDLAHRASVALERALERAEADLRAAREGREIPSGALVAFLRPGGPPCYRRAPAPSAAAFPAPTAEESRLYRLSREGGESFELERGDPFRALDAYAFYLPRIRSPLLRARLRFRAARAARSSGETALARAIEEDLFASAAGARSEEGLPLDILAGLSLAESAPRAEAERLGRRLRARIAEREGELSTPLLRHLASRLAPREAELARRLRSREGIERSWRRARGELERAGLALDGGWLLRRIDLAGGEAALARVALEWPPLELGEGLEARIAAAPPPPARERGRATRPLRPSPAAPALATLEVRDREYALELARIDRLWLLGSALGAIAILVVLAGAAALVRLAVKERRLARLRAQLIANVSHELKSPVTSIRLFSEMLASDPVDEGRARRFGRLLGAESLRLGRLIEDLLDVSRSGRGEEPLECEALDVAPLLERIAEGFGYRAREAGVELELDLPAAQAEGNGARLVALAEPAALERVVLNLLDNALKYRRSEGARVRLAARREGAGVRISVGDNGPGIAAADRKRIFDEFYRARYDDYSVRGSGLGLAIARRLALRMHAELRCESRPGRGSTFLVDLSPADGADAADPAGAQGGAPWPERES